MLSLVPFDEALLPVVHGDVYDRWGQGYGRAMLRAAVAQRAVADVALVALGIDEDNVPSQRCALVAGFGPDDPAPDLEGTVYYLLRSGIRPSRASTGTSTGTVSG